MDGRRLGNGGTGVAGVAGVGLRRAGPLPTGRVEERAHRAERAGRRRDARSAVCRSMRTPSSATRHLVHAGLGEALDPDTLEPKPYAAKSWAWKDAQTLHVELREDVRFHSGAPLTPEDVVKTIAAFQSPEVGSRHLRVVEAIARVEVTGPHAVDVVLARPHATLLIRPRGAYPARADQAACASRSERRARWARAHSGRARSTRGDVAARAGQRRGPPRPAHAVVLRTVHDDNARALRLRASPDAALNVLTLASALAKGRHHAARAARRADHLPRRADGSRPARRRPSAQRRLPRDRQERGSRRRSSRGHADAVDATSPELHWAHADLPPIPFSIRCRARASRLSATAGLRATLLTSTTDRFRA